jgi:hypothetical protein
MPDLTRLAVDLRRLARALASGGTLPSLQYVTTGSTGAVVWTWDI